MYTTISSRGYNWRIYYLFCWGLLYMHWPVVMDVIQSQSLNARSVYYYCLWRWLWSPQHIKSHRMMTGWQWVTYSVNSDWTKHCRHQKTCNFLLWCHRTRSYTAHWQHSQIEKTCFVKLLISCLSLMLSTNTAYQTVSPYTRGYGNSAKTLINNISV